MHRVGLETVRFPINLTVVTDGDVAIKYALTIGAGHLDIVAALGQSGGGTEGSISPTLRILTIEVIDLSTDDPFSFP